jgi:chemotaxis protein methyltransferase CheR
MVLADLSAKHSFRFSVLGTDICVSVLQTAAHGVYSETTIEPVPNDMRRRYLMRSKHDPDQLRIVPELREHIHFERINLIEMPYSVPKDMHIIFVRNVLIYFDKETQHKVLSEVFRHLCPGGYLVLGHSESLSSEDLPLTPVAATVFRRL